MLWSNYPDNLCVLLQVEIVRTWVGNVWTNTPKLRMASTSHLFLVSAWGFKQQQQTNKKGRGVSCFFCAPEVMTPLVTSYYARQSIAKLTTQSYFMIIGCFWLLCHKRSSQYEPPPHPNTFEIRTVSDSVLRALFKASPVSLLIQNHFFATLCWDKVRPSC